MAKKIEKEDKELSETEKEIERKKIEEETGIPQIKNVVIPEDVLSKLIGDIEDLKKQNQMLVEVADRKSMAHWMQRNKGDIPTIIRIRRIDDKIVVGWDDMKPNSNTVGKDPKTMGWVEKQEVMLRFQDGTKYSYGLLDFNQRFEYIPCKKLGSYQDDITGELVFKLEIIETGEQLEISSLFVN